MSMQTYHELKKMLCEELDKMTRKGEIRNEQDLEIIDKLTHSIKSVETIIAMNEAQNHGESGYRMPSYVNWGMSRENDGRSNLADRSNAQRRDSMGRYTSRHGDMVAELYELMAQAKDDHTRMKFQRFIEDLEER